MALLSTLNPREAIEITFFGWNDLMTTKRKCQQIVTKSHENQVDIYRHHANNHESWVCEAYPNHGDITLTLVTQDTY